ncbi:MAG: Gfo/Idh/MocA family oxidoreductase [Verrucomicrobia bacterium]|nr:Gfo/Idh/MocA family oxidoreductase [Verrucomicrobiota bacterium]
MNPKISRRIFLRNSSIAAATFWIGSSAFGKGKSPNDKLNIGIIGTANRAGSNISGVKHQNIVALCDVDDNYLAAASARFPEAKKYNDFRKLLEQKDIDAVVISTTDHTHAVATAAGLKSGRHVYCEKPLTHTVEEARAISQLTARNKKLATQMGTQMHATENYRRVVELVQKDAIGPVTECHVWCHKSRTAPVPTEYPPVPAHLHWDLWIGPVKSRPYHPIFHPKEWRVFWQFGNATLGDMGCHYLDLVFWALKLRTPTSIEAEGPAPHPEAVPEWLIAHWDFPKRGKLPPVKLHWYDSGKRPALLDEMGIKGWLDGVMFVGEKGVLIADYTKHVLYPENKFEGFVAPAPFIPKSIGHYEEWIQACKTGSPTSCNFDYGAALTETVLLGLVAFRSGGKLEWDASKLRVKNNRDAEKFIQKQYRAGWTI